MSEKLTIKNVICHHGEASIEKLKKATKGEIIELLNSSAWQYSSAKDKVSELESRNQKELQDIDSCREMIAAFLGYDITDRDYHNRVNSIENLSLRALVAQLFSVANAGAFVAPVKKKCDD